MGLFCGEIPHPCYNHIQRHNFYPVKSNAAACYIRQLDNGSAQIHITEVKIPTARETREADIQ
jgi:hypothetical protein